MKSKVKLQVKDIYLRFENLYDNSEIMDFFPFVALACKSDRGHKDDPQDKIKNVTFNIYCIETQ